MSGSEIPTERLWELAHVAGAVSEAARRVARDRKRPELVNPRDEAWLPEGIAMLARVLAAIGEDGTP